MLLCERDFFCISHTGENRQPESISHAGENRQPESISHTGENRQAENRQKLWTLLFDAQLNRPILTANQVNNYVVSESLFPSIRNIACQIAMERHHWEHPTPKQFTTASDWFAGRILTLGIRAFYVLPQYFSIIEEANQKANQFAIEHDLPMRQAEIIIDCSVAENTAKITLGNEVSLPSQNLGAVGNALFLKEQMTFINHCNTGICGSFL